MGLNQPCQGFFAKSLQKLLRKGWRKYMGFLWKPDNIPCSRNPWKFFRGFPLAFKKLAIRVGNGFTFHGKNNGFFGQVNGHHFSGINHEACGADFLRETDFGMRQAVENKPCGFLQTKISKAKNLDSLFGATGMIFSVKQFVLVLSSLFGRNLDKIMRGLINLLR